MQSFRALAVACVLLGSASPALAGFKTGQQVVISTASRFANADMGYVFNTTDLTQYIGCAAYSTGGGSCFARGSDGTYVSCYTSNATFLDTIRSISSDSYLLFYWDASGNCTSISVTTASYSQPKKPS